MKLTFLYPIYNRGNLFEKTLGTFLKQDERETLDYELLVVDDGSTCEKPMPIVKEFRELGLPIRCVIVDPTKGGAVYRTATGANNPAVAINIGLKLALGEKLILTSPEVLHAKRTNLKRLVEYELQPKEMMFCNVWDEEFNAYIGGGPGKRALSFLSLHLRQDLLDLGGIDERYMAGWAWEDADFRDRLARAEFKCSFCDDYILGHHQYHPRPDMDPDRPQEFRQAWNRNEELYKLHAKDENRVVANEGCEWGNTNMVVEQWPST